MKTTTIKHQARVSLKAGCGVLLLAAATLQDASAQTNTKVGSGAGLLFSTGTNNTAVGAGALTTDTTGGYNTGVGSSALRRNNGINNVGLGYQSLYKNTLGGNNVGVGNKTLLNNLTGSGNIALGTLAGSATNGSNNISIGNLGVAGENGVIRIGDISTHSKTYLNGRTSITANGGGSNTPTGHVVLIKEQAGFTAGLAIQSNYNGVHATSDNFITFFNSLGNSIGSIEGNGGGSVQLGGAGSDYAEYIEKADPSMKIDATEIVGVRDGKIVSHGQSADQFMIVTAQAIVAGNRPSENPADLASRSLVSFIGQVPVQVRGQVNSGDFILASEKGDGTGIALPASKIDTAAMPRVVGRAWEASKEDGLKTVNTAVGLDQTSLVVPALQRLEKENQELRERMTKENLALQQRLAQLEKLLLEKSAESGLVKTQH